MIFVTGGTGLLGRYLILELIRRGHRVIALTRSPAAEAEMRALGATALRGRVEDSDSWRPVNGVTAIIHSAAVIVSRGGWAEFERVNVQGTRLAAARAFALDVPLLHVSSVAVYGRGATREPGELVSEDFPFGQLHPSSHYARSKRAAEQVVWDFVGRGLRAAAFRPCVIYGEGDRTFTPALARSVRAGRFPVIGAGDRPLALVHGANVAQGIVAALAVPDPWGRAYNLTNDGDIFGRDLPAALAAGLGRQVRALRIPERTARIAASVAERMLFPWLAAYPSRLRSAVSFLAGDNTYTSGLARRALGWAPVVSHGEALPRAIAEAGQRMRQR